MRKLTEIIATMAGKKKIQFYNKMGNGHYRNHLFVLARKHTLHIGWIDHGNGPVVYSTDKYHGRPENLIERGYSEMEPAMAATILTSAIKDLKALMPSMSFS